MLSDNFHQAKILIVDDEIPNIRLIEDLLRVSGYEQIRSLCDPRGVLRLFVEFEPDIVLLDLNMPHISGFELLKMMTPLAEDDFLPVLILTADHSFEARHQALSDGASDLLTKPYQADEVLVRISNLLRLRFRTGRLLEKLRQRTQELGTYQVELQEAQLETTLRLARAAEHRDDDTGKHTQRVGALSGTLAQSLGLSGHQVQLLQYAAPLHDVGKIGIPDSILLKPGKFTGAERKIMERHAQIGAELLAGGHSDVVRMAERIALTHHERWNGTGYPRGIAGEQIDIEGRILAVADVFDALSHARPYKSPWPLDEAVAEIANQRGQQFDPDVVDCFLGLRHEDYVTFAEDKAREAA